MEKESKAPRFYLGKHKVGKRQDFVEGEEYRIRFKFKNLGETTSPPALAAMVMSWTSNQAVTWSVKIPNLEPRQEGYGTVRDNHSEDRTQALADGFGLLICTSIAPTNIDLLSFDETDTYEIGQNAHSVDAVKVTTWNTIYSAYAMFASVIALLIIAANEFVQFLFWLIAHFPKNCP